MVYSCALVLLAQNMRLNIESWKKLNWSWHWQVSS